MGKNRLHFDRKRAVRLRAEGGVGISGISGCGQGWWSLRHCSACLLVTPCHRGTSSSVISAPLQRVLVGDTIWPFPTSTHNRGGSAHQCGTSAGVQRPRSGGSAGSQRRTAGPQRRQCRQPAEDSGGSAGSQRRTAEICPKQNVCGEFFPNKTFVKNFPQTKRL